MLSEKQIFDMSKYELDENIKTLNQVHINIKKREKGEDFSYWDCGGKKEDLISDDKLIKIIEKLGIPELKNNLNSKIFYNLVEPILGHIIHKNLGEILKGYQIEEMGIQTSLPLSVNFIVDNYSASENNFVPHSKEAEDITYSELEEKIIDSLLNIKYMLNKGQCGIREYINLDSYGLKEVKAKYDFHTLNQELKSDTNKVNKKTKL